MRKSLLAILGVGGLASLLAGCAPDVPDEITQQVMQIKLRYAQKALEGVATENYILIATNAQRLSHLSQTKGWFPRRTPEYEAFSAEFRKQADALAAAAEEKNLAAATEAYHQLTLSCVNCHRYLRVPTAADRP